MKKSKIKALTRNFFPILPEADLLNVKGFYLISINILTITQYKIRITIKNTAVNK